MRALDPEVVARILELHGNGLSRNEIAAATGVSGGTVTNYVHRAGLTFDRAATRRAVEARQIDQADLRTKLSGGLLQDALAVRRRIHGSVPARELQAITQSLAALTRAYKDLATASYPAAPEDLDDLRAMLADMFKDAEDFANNVDANGGLDGINP